MGCVIWRLLLLVRIAAAATTWNEMQERVAKRQREGYTNWGGGFWRMKSEYVKSPVQKLSGGSLIYAEGTNESNGQWTKPCCTISFCWEPKNVADLLTVCMTVNQIAEDIDPASETLLVQSRGQQHKASAVFRSPDHDVLVVNTSVRVDPLVLLEECDRVPIVGFTEAMAGDAVWKLGAETAVTVGKVGSVGLMDIEVEAIYSANGDPGGAMCLAHSFTECILVGMVLGGNAEERVVRGLRSQIMANVVPFWPLQFIPNPLRGLVVAKPSSTASAIITATGAVTSR